MIKIDIINKTPLKLDEEGIKSLCQKVYQARYKDFEVYLEVMAVSIDEITKLNQLHLQRSGPTDVISFPNVNPENDRNISLGSIVFAPEYLKHYDECEEFVVEHGLLHLMGFDHEQNQNEWDQELKELQNDLSKI
jgi:probable rRNA maturation factor